MSAGTTVVLQPPLAPEEQARADIYALLGRLYTGAPDAALLEGLGGVHRLPETAGDGWARTFNRLADASLVMDPAAAEQEYTDLFVGVGHSEVDLHASYWLTGGEAPLPQLRDHLAALGLARRPEATLMEDHLAPLLETMRMLIAGAPGIDPAPVATQRAFFDRWLAGWPSGCCDAINRSSIANYYRRVAECTNAFLALERDSFAME